MFLRLQPYRQMAVAWRHNLMSPRFYGPLMIMKKLAQWLIIWTYSRVSNLPCVPRFSPEVKGTKGCPSNFSLAISESTWVI